MMWIALLKWRFAHQGINLASCLVRSRQYQRESEAGEKNVLGQAHHLCVHCPRLSWRTIASWLLPLTGDALHGTPPSHQVGYSAMMLFNRRAVFKISVQFSGSITVCTYSTVCQLA
ncbi:hypothetical protein VFPPC_17586 [Pochonia chlamydosporia 170]|uniref:Uncharacterized protein n=1 Tax=Pochonia chlamydosporia 170 TaxID=1380566 RepID=A0A219AR61_METCM|nr:hypothetical protein VFPPC_17586 [Pochonia chlamydosporia 170]OWT43251.1 hypothetical protein VFPPC_17586 [Pochonia chlamydosporia 170]